MEVSGRHMEVSGRHMDVESLHDLISVFPIALEAVRMPLER